MDDPFWTGGPAAYTKELREKHKKTISELQSRLSETTDETDREELAAKIAESEDELRSKLKGIDESLF